MRTVQPKVQFPRQYLEKAWEKVLNGGSNAAGVDGVRLDDVKGRVDDFLDEIYEKIISGSYHPSEVKEITINQNGKNRKIGILTLEDRIVHTMIKVWLEPICQPKFSKNSYAYQSGKSANQAVEEIEKKISEGNHWIGETDIQNFFDEIDHTRLQSLLLTFVDDHEKVDFILYLFRSSGRGITQGSPLSPLLANIYLHSFDEYMARDAKPYIRYSDDILILDQSREAVEKRLNVMEDALEALKLSWNIKKTGIKQLKETFTFLGFTFTSSGKTVAEKGVSSLNSKLREIFETQRSYEQKEEQYRSVIRGWQQYYDIIPWKDIEHFDALLLIVEFEPHSDTLTNVYKRVVSIATNHTLENWHFIKLVSISMRIDFHVDALFWLSFYYEKNKGVPLLFKDWLLNRYSLQKENYEPFFKFLKKIHVNNDEENLNNLSEWLLSEELFLLAKDLHEPVSPLKFQKSLKDHKLNEKDVFSHYLGLFSGKEDTFLIESFLDGRRTFSPIHRALNVEDVNQHYKGELTVAQYLIRSNKTVSYAVIDIDVGKNLLKSSSEDEFLISKRKVAFGDTLKVLDRARKSGFQGTIVDSGYRGYHIWFFFSEPIDLKYAFLFLNKIVSESGGPSEGIVWERFPKQKKLGEHKNGQAIKLPWGKHSVSNQQSWFLNEEGLVVKDQLAVIGKVPKISRERLLTYVNQPNVQDIVTQNRLPIEETKLPQATRMILSGCPVMRHMVEKAKKTAYLNHQERLLLLNVFAPIGEEGHRFIHRVIGQTMNYHPGTTDKFIKRSYNKPISCIRIREHFPGLTAQLPCNCQFPLKSGGYPSPVLHHQKLEYLVKRKAQKPVKKPEKNAPPVTTQKIEESSLKHTQKVNELALRLIELRKQQRGIKKSLRKIENELAQIFNDHNVDHMEIDLGDLIREKNSDQFEWVIRI